MFADQALERIASDERIQTILDVGSGSGEQAAAFRRVGKSVTTISLIEPADFIGSWTEFTDSRKFDCLWCSHILEHQRNVGQFLDWCRDRLVDRGVLAVTVPPAKTPIVGGHINLFTGRSLIYNLVLAGFDCSRARVGFYGYNMSVIVRYVPFVMPELTMDIGDIELLAPYFPFPVKQNDDHKLLSVRW